MTRTADMHEQCVAAIDAVIDHYCIFMEREFTGFIHNSTHLQTFNVHDSIYANSPNFFLCQPAAILFHKTGVPDERKRYLMQHAFGQMRVHRAPYFVRKQKNVFAAAHAKYFKMVATFQASSTMNDHLPLEASNIRSIQLPTINAVAASIPQSSRTVHSKVNHSQLSTDGGTLDTLDTSSIIGSRKAAKKVAGKRRASAASQRKCANADSGATGTYLALADRSVLRELQTSTAAEQIEVRVADGNIIRSTHYGYLDVPGHGAMIAHVFPHLAGSLFSISAVVDMGLEVLYCKDLVSFLDSNKSVVFQGERDKTTGLLMVVLEQFSLAGTETPLVAAPAIRLESVADSVNFWHGAFGSPALSTFIPAVEKGWIRVPGLTAN